MYGLLDDPKQQMSPITAAQLPAFSQPNFPAPPQSDSLLGRLKHKIGGLLGDVSDSIRPHAPGGYEGLGLSPDEIKQARPSLLQSLIGAPDGPGASERYQQNLNGIVQRKQAAQQMQMQQQEMARREELRKRLGAQYPNFPAMSPEQQKAAVTGIFGEMLKEGLFDEAGKVASVIPSMNQNASAGPNLQHIDAGGTVKLVDPKTGAIVGEIPKTPSPRDPNAPDTAAMRREQMSYMREQGLADDFNKDTKDTRDNARAIQQALGEAARAKAGDGTAQVNLLYAFVKAMDEGSAVREGEIGLVRSAGSLPQQARAMLDKFGRGQAVVIPSGMIDQMANLMRRRVETSQRYVKSRAEYYRKRGAKWGVDASAFPELDLPPTAAPAPAGAARARGGNPLLEP